MRPYLLGSKHCVVALLKRLEGHSGFPTEATSLVAVSPSALWLTQTEQGWKQPSPSFYRQAIHFPLAAKPLWSVVSNGWTWASSYSTPQRRRGPSSSSTQAVLSPVVLTSESVAPTYPVICAGNRCSSASNPLPPALCPVPH